MSWFSKNVAAPVTSLAKGVLGFGGSSGPSNPYGAADFSKLLDFSNLDFLKKGYGENADTNKLFQDYIGSINAPSSTDEVTKRVEGQLMQSLLSGVDTNTANAAGSLKSDFLDRGISGPGMISDIEANSLGGLYTNAAKNKGDIQSQFALQELQRQSDKEKAAQAAYGQQYATGAGYDQANQTQLADLINQRLIAAVTGQASAYGNAANTQQAGVKPGVVEDILRNIKLSFGK